MENQKKIVLFDQYCKKCIHKNVPEVEDPCNRCLTHSVNDNSHKPVNYIPKEENNERT